MEYKHMVRCFCCGQEFQFGPHSYNGTRSQRYDFMVCTRCHDANWDGWAPHYEAQILDHLRAKNTEPPERNSKGLLPRD
jgi:hypothetical protein